MATIGTINPFVARAQRLNGCQVLALPYTDVDDGETVTLSVPIQEVAWKGDTDADTMTPSYLGRVVTFHHESGAVGHDGTLWVWYGSAG